MVWIPPVTKRGKDEWFELQNVPDPRLGIPPPSAMGTVLKVFNENCLTHPWNPDVFVVPFPMTHLWRRNLGKDMDVIFTVQVEKNFWDQT